MDPFLNKNLISNREASSLSGYSSDYLARLCRAKKIKGVQMGRAWFIDRESLELFSKGQDDRNLVRARTLQRVREKEYESAHSPVQKVARVLATPLEIPSVPFASFISPTLKREVVALATALLVVGSAGYVAEAGLLSPVAAHAAEMTLLAAKGFGMLASDAADSVRERLARIDAGVEEAKRASSRAIGVYTESFSLAVLSHPDITRLAMPVELAVSQRVVAPSQVAPAQASRDVVFVLPTFANLRTMSVRRVLDTIASAYVTIGTATYGAVRATLDGYLSFIERAGDRALALGAFTRDAVVQTPDTLLAANLKLGRTLIDGKDAALSFNRAVAYGVADAAPKSATVTVALVGSLGDRLATAAARAPQTIARAYLRATETLAALAPWSAEKVAALEYAGAERFVLGLEVLLGGYEKYLVRSGDALYAITENGRSLGEVAALALSSFPDSLEGETLGVLGRSAVAFNGLAASVAALPQLTFGQKVALSAYETVHGFFASLGESLATVFAPRTTIVVVPPTPEYPLATAASTTAPIPVTVVAGPSISYPTYQTIVKGASNDFVVNSLEGLRSSILQTVGSLVQPISNQVATNATTIQQVNMIQDLSNLIVRNGDFRGGTFDSGNVTNAGTVSATTGSFGNLTAGATTLATTTINGTISISGPFSLGVVISGSSISAPYFVATSSNATSTFAGSLAVDTDGFVYATTTRNVGIGTTSPYAKLSVVGGIVGTTLTATSTTNSFSIGGTKFIHITASTTETDGNTYVGFGSGDSVAANNATENTAVGAQTLAALTSGADNTAIGHRALNANTSGSNNNAFGQESLSFNTTGGNNNAFGANSLRANTTGSNNAAFGPSALGVNTTGSNNIAFGFQAGDNLTTGSNNIIIGYDIDATSTTMTGGLNIGNLIFGTGIDGTGTTLSSGKIGIGTTSPYAKLSVVGEAVAEKFSATSTTATSTVAGGLAVGTTGIVYDFSSGRVGVGTAAPATKLDVSGTGRFSSSLSLSSVLNCTGGQGLQTDGSGTINCATIASGGASNAGGWVTDNVGVVTLATTTDRAVVGASTTPYAKLAIVSGNTATTTLALVTSSAQTANILDIYNTSGALGSVFTAGHFFGIGTTSPAANLSVGGNGYFTGGLGVGVVNTTAGTLNVSGNVGIGTTSPYAKLSVVGPVVAEYFHATSTTATSTFDGGFRAAGTAGLTVLQNGRVGIGATDPTAKLQVDGTGGTSQISLNETGVRRWLLGAGQAASGVFSIRNGSTDFDSLVVDANNNVGIGTTTPAQTLAVQGSALFSGDLSLANLTATGTITAATFAATNFTTTNATSSNLFGGTFTANTFAAGQTGTTTITSAGFVGVASTSPWAKLSINPVAGDGAAPAFAIGSSTATKFVVTNGGLVGVGTSSPAAALNVDSGSATAPGVQVNIPNGSNDYLRLVRTGASNTDWYIGNASGNLTFGPNTIASSASRLFQISAAGAVGIGSTTPWAQLSVNPNGITGPAFAIGSSTATNFVVTNGGKVGVGTSNPYGVLSVADATTTNSTARTFTQVGSSLAVSTVSNPTLAALSPNRVAFIDDTNDSLRVYEFNGSTWTQVGAGLSISTVGSPTLAALSPNRVAFIDDTNDSLRVYEFNGSTWSQVGSSLAISNVIDPTLAALSPSRVVLADTGGSVLRVYDFNGSTWSQVGSDFSPGTPTTPTLAALSPNRVAFIDAANNSLRTYEFNDITWIQVGSGLSVSTFGIPNLVAISPSRVVFADSSSNTLRTYEFNGLAWSQVGTSLSISAVGTPALAALSPNRVAFIDDTNDSLRTYQWSTPVLYVANTTDFPYLAISDAGYTTAEALSVRTELRVGQSATSTTSTSSPALIVSGNASFLTKVGVGTTSPERALSVIGGMVVTDAVRFSGLPTATGGGVCINTTTFELTISLSGSCSASARRYKENIEDLRYGLSEVNMLRAVSFDWKKSYMPNGTPQIGFIADEVESIIPEVVGYDSSGEIMSLDYPKLTSVLTRAIQQISGALDVTSALSGTSTLKSSYQGTTTPAITVDASGKVGIGTNTPSYALHVAGDVAAISFVNTSTRSAKTDIAYVSEEEAADMLAKVRNLKVAEYRYTTEEQSNPLRVGLIAEDAAQVAPEVLSVDGKGVDIYKLATFTLAGTQALAAKVDVQEARMNSLEERIAKLEDGSIASASGSPISFSTSTLKSALSELGILVEKGIAQFNTLVFRQLVASKDADGTSSAGSVSILAGNTVAQVNNSLVATSTKVFVTFNAPVVGSWYVSDKQQGSFRVILAAPQATDVSFDYFLVQTEGQLATSTQTAAPAAGAAGPSVSQSGTTANAITLLGDNPVHLALGDVFTEPGISIGGQPVGAVPYTTFVNGLEQEVSSTTISTATPTTHIITYRALAASGDFVTAMRSVIVGNPDGTVTSSGTTSAPTSGDSVAPVVTLQGEAAIQLSVGDTFTDPGATALDETDGDVSASIRVTGAVDTATEGMYTLTYAATDAAGNVGGASRLVTVVAPVASTTAEI